MKKKYSIYFRHISNINTYFPQEKFEKWYCLNVKNEFDTREQASWFIQNPANYDKFDEFNEYFVQEVYIKTLIKPEIKDGF